MKELGINLYLADALEKLKLVKKIIIVKNKFEKLKNGMNTYDALVNGIKNKINYNTNDMIYN